MDVNGQQRFTNWGKKKRQRFYSDPFALQIKKFLHNTQHFSQAHIPNLGIITKKHKANVEKIHSTVSFKEHS